MEVYCEMNDTSGKTSSCLAITEKKKKQGPGGCIGLFFQLFDWNGKLSKKKLFSKKLLPPGSSLHTLLTLILFDFFFFFVCFSFLVCGKC